MPGISITIGVCEGMVTATMLPNYLPIEKAVSLIHEKYGVCITSDRLMQLAHEGKIELYALAREPIYFIEQTTAASIENNNLSDISVSARDGDQPDDFRPAKLGGFSVKVLPLATSSPHIMKKGEYRVSKALYTAALKLADKPPEPERALSTDAMKNNRRIQHFAIADYVPLEPAWAGRIFASRDIPRATHIPTMLISGTTRLIFTSKRALLETLASGDANGFIKQSNSLLPGCWVTENDLFLKTLDLDLFATTSGTSSVSTVAEPETSEKDQKLSVSPKRKRTPTPLTTGQIKPEIWPTPGGGLRKAMANTKSWLKDARVTPGRPGKPATWNPARLALCHIETSATKHWKVSQQTLEDFLIDNFPEWMEEWYQLVPIDYHAEMRKP